MKDEIKTKPDEKAAAYGEAIENILNYANRSMKQGLVDKMLSIPDADKAETYGWALRKALEYAGADIKESVVDRIFSIADAQKKEETHR